MAENSRISPLAPMMKHVTGYDNKTGKSIIHSSDRGNWTESDNGAMEFNVIYTNNHKPDLNDSADLKEHDATLSKGDLGLVKPEGTVCRIVDFKPSYTCMMHRTSSLDFGVVLEGEVEMQLDDGSRTLMKRGDVAVQRATMHAWRNASKTSWARMLFVLQDIKALEFNGQVLKEDLGDGTGKTE